MSVQPVVDVHQHMGPWPFYGRWGGIEQNLRLMTSRGIDVAVVSAARAVVEDMVSGNAELAQSIKGHTRLYGYIAVNPTVPQLSLAELRRYRANPQFVGVKIHTHYSGCAMSDPRMGAMLGLLREWGRPVLIHTWGASEVAALVMLAQRYPELQIIAAHAGGDAWRLGIAAARACPNLHLDFACSVPYRGALACALGELGPQRVLLGTDATLFDPLYVKAVYDHTPMSDSDRALVMGGNAVRLFGLGATA
jgi:hypothetical protein